MTITRSPLRLGVVGLGAVGLATVKVLQDQASLLAERAGRPIQIVAVCARNAMRDRGVDLSSYRWYDDALALTQADDIDVVIELIGGAEGAARALVTTALQKGKAVVTANKALLSVHGVALAGLAEKARTVLAFEAAVAGGMPVIKLLREGMSANHITSIRGILNGTCNDILSRMAREDCDFPQALQAAQSAGFAEADPTLDIDGYDAMQKIALLAMIAFGVHFDLGQISRKGIRHIQRHDILQARRDGKMIKLIASASRQGDKIRVSVAPETLLANDPLALLQGPMNAAMIQGHLTGAITLTGAGAGGEPTASAVLADVLDIAQGRSALPFGCAVAQLRAISLA